MSFIRDSPSPTCPLYMIHLHLHVHYTWLTFTFMSGIKLFTFKYMSVIHNLPSSTCPLYIFTFRDMSIIHAYPGQKKPLFHTVSPSIYFNKRSLFWLFLFIFYILAFFSLFFWKKSLILFLLSSFCHFYPYFNNL